MKKLSITLMMLCCAIVGNAQVTDEISAILQVGDNAQIFYGADALIEAMAAAPDRGATITLSSVRSMPLRLPNVSTSTVLAG